jgi:hypothetical protein
MKQFSDFQNANVGLFDETPDDSLNNIMGFNLLMPPPPPPTIATVKFSVDTGISSTDFITNTTAQKIDGTLGAAMVSGDVVKVSVDNGVTWLNATTTVGQSTWALNNVNLLSGAHNLVVKLVDSGGVLKGTALTQAYTLDKTAPAASSTPDMIVASDTGFSTTDNITKTTTPTFTGTAETGATVTLYDSNGTKVLGSTTVVSGAWSITSTALTDGTHTLITKVVDVAGNVSSTSSLSVQIDNAAPTPVAISAYPGASGNMYYVASFNEVVKGVDASDFNIVASNAGAGTISDITTTDGKNYLITVGSLAEKGFIRLDLNATATNIVDLAGNAIAIGYKGGTYTESPDKDADGIPDLVEAKVLNSAGTSTGDGNGDGIADNTQKSVTSYSTFPRIGDSANIVTIANNKGLAQTSVTPDASPSGMPVNVVTQFGSVSYTLEKVVSGSEVQMSVFVDSSDPVNGYWKQNDLGKWLNIATAITTVGNKLRIDYTLKDGGSLDGDGTVNGSISDLGVIGFMPKAALTVDAFTVAGVTARNAGGVDFTVKFSDPVKNVDVTDFKLVALGTAFGSISKIDKIDDSSYAIHVDKVTGTGSLSLSIGTSSDIIDQSNNHISKTFTSTTHITQSNVVDHTNSEKIASLYTLLFHRAPDQEGLNYWLQQMTQGKTMQDISAAFAGNSRYMTDYAKLSNQEFVQTLYTQGLGNAGDTEGVNYWTGKINAGENRTDMLAEFALSAMTVDLVGLHNLHLISDTDFLAASARQNSLFNRIDVGLEFVKQFGSATNPKAATDTDVAYHAAQLLLGKLDGSDESLQKTLTTLHATKAIGDVATTFVAGAEVTLTGIQHQDVAF